MNVVDSSGWLEYFADGPNAPFFASAVEKPAELLVPTISIYEVFKRILQQKDETDALRAVAAMQQATVIPLDEAAALSAARLSLEAKLPMADSIMLACARASGAVLWTQDKDFKDIEGVRYIDVP
ncbi:MAG TPA: type II toxin-antitoxin system VapC family toxin [Bacillota bacterium]|nr:type II toxin-antitoxin system VapC family toxin [Bacillota bacterium]